MEAYIGLLLAVLDVPPCAVRVAGRDEELRGSAARNPAVTLIVETTGVPGPDGTTIEVPDGTAIVCRGTQCSLPVRTVDELERLLAR